MWAAIKARLRRSEPSGPSPSTEPAAPIPSPGSLPSLPPPSAPPPRRDSVPIDDPSRHFAEGAFGHRLKETTLDDALDDLEIVLLQSDVALPVAEKLEANLKRDLLGRKLRWGADAETAIRDSLAHSVRAILARPPFDLVKAIRDSPTHPYVILFLGVNGTGKTTTIAKIAGWLKHRGITSVVAAGDTFRAGAIEQLLVHGERLGIRVVRQQEGSDPAAVAFDAIEHARAKGIPVVLVDTAGRQHTNENLIAEAQKIRRIAKPQLTLFVGDALSGNDVVEQAKLFDASLGIDGLVLTKLDADTKGGSAVSVVYVTQKPIVFVGTGQGYDDLAPFDPDWMVRRLFGEGTAA